MWLASFVFYHRILYCHFIGCFFSNLSIFSVITTEKTNILLRYLHQQWDRKVSFIILPLFTLWFLVINCLLLCYFNPFPKNNRSSANNFEDIYLMDLKHCDKSRNCSTCFQMSYVKDVSKCIVMNLFTHVHQHRLLSEVVFHKPRSKVRVTPTVLSL